MKSTAMTALVLTLTLTLAGCAENKTIDGTVYETYGLANRDEVRDPNIAYTVSTGNVIWGILLCETLVAPIYFFGWSLYEPVGPKRVTPSVR